MPISILFKRFFFPYINSTNIPQSISSFEKALKFNSRVFCFLSIFLIGAGALSPLGFEMLYLTFSITHHLYQLHMSLSVPQIFLFLMNLRLGILIGSPFHCRQANKTDLNKKRKIALTCH